MLISKKKKEKIEEEEKHIYICKFKISLLIFWNYDFYFVIIEYILNTITQR